MRLLIFTTKKLAVLFVLLALAAVFVNLFSFFKKIIFLDNWCLNGPKKARAPIPKIIHFAVGFDDILSDETYDLYLIQYLAIKAAKVNGHLDEVYLHYHYKPHGIWFDKALKYIDKLVKVETLPSRVFNQTIRHFAHKKDVYLIRTLLENGGIFADLDVIILRRLDELLQFEMVMPREGITEENTVLLNALTMASSTSKVLFEWYDAYKNFNNSQWNYFCCRIPWLLALKQPCDVHVLDPFAVSVPSWAPFGIKSAFFHRYHNYSLRNYATHLWETVTRPIATRLTIRKIWALETSLFCELRKLTLDEEGAGVMTPEMEQNCATIDPENVPTKTTKTSKGLVGSWDLRNLTAEMLPKIWDSSENKMHGLLSPMNSFDLVNPLAVINQPDFMAFRGDHIYLPMLPQLRSDSGFTLIFWARFATCKRQTTTVASVEFYGDTASLHLELSGSSSATNCSRRWLQLSLEYNTEKLIDAVNSTQLPLSDGDVWFLLSISCDVQQCLLRLNSACSPSSNSFNLIKENNEISVEYSSKSIESQLQGVWLGRRQVANFLLVNHDTDAYCDISDVRVYDKVLRTQEIVHEMSKTRCLA